MTETYFRLALFIATLAFPVSLKSAEINSVFQGSIFEPWSMASNWLPSGVPNNDNGNTYNVTIGSASTFQSVDLDIDVTVDNVDSYSGFNATDNSLTVLETTNLRGKGLTLTAENADMEWSLGNLVDFSNGSLPGTYWLRADPGRELTVRFNGANITTNTASLQLWGVGVKFVDENGLSALRNLTSNERTLNLREGVSLTTTGTLSNTGGLQVGYGGGSLTVNGDLLCPGGISLLASDVFDPPESVVEVTVHGSLITGPETQLIIGGAETIPASLIVHGTYDGLTGTVFNSAASVGGTFQFDDALITENAGRLSIATPNGQIIDQNGSNAITNLVRNHEGAEFAVTSGKTLILPGGFQNEGTFKIQSAATPGINDTEVTITGDLINSGLIELIAATRAAHLEVSGDMNNSGSLQINTRGVMPGSGRITGELTNSGTVGALTGFNAPSALLEIGSLANLSGTTLTGGQYVVFCPQYGVATLRIPGANIVTNRAYIYMSGPAGLFDDGTGNSALRNLAVNDTGGTLAFDNGINFVTGPTFTNNGSILINYLDSRILNSASLTIPGELTNFSNKTLTGGSYSLRADGPTRAATLRFNGADIVTNAASLQLFGEDSRILDENDLNGLRNFAVNTETGSFSTDQNVTTAGNFRNDGLIEVYSFGLFGSETTFTVTGQLENFSAGTLTGGSYFLRGDNNPASLQFTGADIVTNAAQITLVGEGSIVDETGQDGLRNLAANEDYLGLDDHDLLLKGNFSNSGYVYINNCDLSLPAGGIYTQTAGTTWLDDQGIIAPGGVRIQGGRLSGEGRIEGDLTLSIDAELEFDLSQEDRFEIQGEVNLGGSTLRIVLPGDFSAAPDETIAAMTASGGFTGSFSNAADSQRLLSTDGKGSFLVSYQPGTNSITLSEYRIETRPTFTTVSLAGDTLTLAWDPFGDATNYSVQISSLLTAGSWDIVAEINDGTTSSQISLPAGNGPYFVRVISP